jgi:hypothetical protein
MSLIRRFSNSHHHHQMSTTTTTSTATTTSTEEQVRVCNNKYTNSDIEEMSNEELIQTIDRRYFDDSAEFDSVRYILEQADDDQLLSLSYLDLEMKRYKKALQHVNEQLATTVMNNYTAFVQGMNKVQEIGLDVTRTAILCKNGRKQIQSAEKDIIANNLSVIAKYKKRSTLLSLLVHAKQMQKLIKQDKEIGDLLEQEDLPSAIEAIVKHQIELQSYKQYACVHSLERSAHYSYDTLTKKLEALLIKILHSFDPIRYEKLLVAQKLLDISVVDLTQQVYHYYTNAIDALVHEIVLSFAIRNTRAKDRIEDLIKYVQLILSFFRD